MHTYDRRWFHGKFVRDLRVRDLDYGDSLISLMYIFQRMDYCFASAASRHLSHSHDISSHLHLPGRPSLSGHRSVHE